HLLVPLRRTSLGPAAAAPGALGALQHPQAPGREPARVSAVQLARARCVAVHLAGGDPDRAAVLRGGAPGGRARRGARTGGRRAAAATATPTACGGARAPSHCRRRTAR